VPLAQGGAKVQEAMYIYQELGDKFNWSVSGSQPGPGQLACTTLVPHSWPVPCIKQC
jgi:hypothetical protein